MHKRDFWVEMVATCYQCGGVSVIGLTGWRAKKLIREGRARGLTVRRPAENRLEFTLRRAT